MKDSVIEHVFDRQPPNQETIKRIHIRITKPAARNAEASKEALTPAGAHQAGHEHEQHK